MALRRAGITVVVRVRPLNEMERARGDAGDGVRCLDDRTVQIGPRQLTFDAALGGPDQEQVFERTEVRPLLDASLQGYATTILAYGQTGSGKTYTMSGPEPLPDAQPSAAAAVQAEGIIPRAVRHLFRTLETHRSAQAGLTYAVSASYLEIYNEHINDLLNPASTGLPIRWNAQQGFFVEGLIVADCETEADLMMVFQEGTRNRKVGSHELNKDSSRSHSIMQVQVTSWQKMIFDGIPGISPEDAQHGIETNGRLSFVDLAGSERLDLSGSVGDAARETAHINKSLLVLSKVISALSAGADTGRIGHVPYRDSKLTKLLSDSLGGATMAMMIGCVSPAGISMDESASTLHYLSAAKKIENRPVVQTSQASGIAISLKHLQDEVQSLRIQNRQLHELLSAAHATGSVPLSGSGRSTPYGTLISADASLQRQATVPDYATELRRRDRQVAEIRTEVQTLRQQNSHLQMANHLLQKSYDDMKRDNDVLQDKLERLERVFVDQDHDLG